MIANECQVSTQNFFECGNARWDGGAPAGRELTRRDAAAGLRRAGPRTIAARRPPPLACWKAQSGCWHDTLQVKQRKDAHTKRDANNGKARNNTE